MPVITCGERLETNDNKMICSAGVDFTESAPFYLGG